MLFVLAMDADSHRQRIINWIDGTGKLSTAFDFTTKGILQVFFKYLLTEIIFLSTLPSKKLHLYQFMEKLKP